MRPRTRVLLLILAGLMSVAASAVQQDSLDRYGLTLKYPEWLWIHLVTGWVFLIAGLVAARTRPDSRIGNLMALFALVWIASLIFVAPLIRWHDIGSAVAGYGLLFVILLAFPTGRLHGWERWAAALWIGYVAVSSTVLVALSDYFFAVDDPLCCPEHLLLIDHDRGLLVRIRLVVAIIGLPVIVGLLVVLFNRWRKATRAGRRKLSVATVALPLMTVLVLIPFIADALGPFFIQPPHNFYIQNGALLILPAVILTSLVRTRLTYARIADMMLDLDAAPTPEAVESRLQMALGTQDARLLFLREGSEEYVRIDGKPFDPGDRNRVTTALDDHTAVAHDPELDAGLVRSAGAAARMAIENVRLQAELRSQLIDVRESRRRLISATDEARRGVERDLHDGAQQRLVTLSSTLKSALGEGAVPADVQELLSEAARETDVAISELRELAHGVHPAILTQAGLGPAVSTLTDRASIPVTVDIAPGRYGSEVEATAYFFIAEGLSNAFKHSGAQTVSVSAAPVGDEFQIVVEDNGTGGVDPSGFGLRGLRDRILGVGGRCRFDEGDLGGARLSAWIPLSPEGS